ncbi:MAG: hypothetical protein GSR72_03570 [Desulfurococcales archaeon]|nr:hypothetical protein [Desulfurococcales archaeon]
MSLTVERWPVKAEETWQEEEIASNSMRIVLAMYPGERVAFPLAVNGPPGHRIGIHARGFPQLVASITITPRSGVAPFTSEIEIRANEGATPGLYYFDLQIIDRTKRRVLGVEPLGLLILPKNLPRNIARHYSRLRRIFRELGAQGVLWYLIAKVYTKGASFTELKKAYELVRGSPVRKAALAVILRRMIKKGLVSKSEDGKYYPLVTKHEAAFSRIDKKRVRITPSRKSVRADKKRESLLPERSIVREPYQTRIAFRKAQKIARKHGALAAAYFLVYNLVGVRETGFLLMWLNAMFVYCEQKTGFCHYFYSQLLHHYFQLLGLREGIMHKHSQEHLEAMKIAHKHVRKYYESHQFSRRLHYELKRQGYLEYDEEIYNVEIIHYEDGDLGVRLWDNNMNKILHDENIVDKPVVKREIKPVYPYEHIYEPNEETYFH